MKKNINLFPSEGKRLRAMPLTILNVLSLNKLLNRKIINIKHTLNSKIILVFTLVKDKTTGAKTQNKVVIDSQLFILQINLNKSI